MGKVTHAQMELESLRTFCQGDPIMPEPRTAIINGMEFEVSYHLVNRKCYEHIQTATEMFKVNGKRISRSAAFKLLAD